MKIETIVDFIKVAAGVSLFYTGFLMMIRIGGVLSGRYNLPPYIIFWTFLGLFLGTLLGLCFNYGGGVW